MTALARLWREAVAACDPADATARALARPEVARALTGRRAWIAAVGKAAAGMAAGAGRALAGAIAGGIIVVPDGVSAAGPLDVRRAAHPVPDARSEAAGRALLALAAQVPPGDALVALISGGASALAAVPAPGVTLAEKVARVTAAAAAGAPIAELNRLRASMSAIKGGRLAAACGAPVVTVVISDVVGDDLATIGSGPTVGPAAAGRAGDVAVLAAGVGTLAAAAAAAAPAILGVPPGAVTIVDDAAAGDVDAVSARVVAAIRGAAPAAVRIWAGEPTITLPPRPGRGGRARHLALTVARALAGVPGWSLLAAGSDGVDGTADGAGAVVDGDTWARLAAAGIDGDAALAGRDAGTALAGIGAALPGAPTGVNHADLWVAHVVDR